MNEVGKFLLPSSVTALEHHDDKMRSTFYQTLAVASSLVAPSLQCGCETEPQGIIDDPASFASKTFDYLVVGGGTAGLVVAARLSESGEYSVGVLEAGINGFNTSIIDIPGEFGADLSTIYDWNYTTEAVDGVPSGAWPRGKVLGGSSALNFLVWDRFTDVEGDAFEELGNPGWNWTTFYNAAKKSEDYTPPSAADSAEMNIEISPSDYGSSGPVQVSFPRWVGEFSKLWIDGFAEIGVAATQKGAAGDNFGAQLQPSNINIVNSTRSYSAPAYLFPNQARPNLAVLTSALVSKVNLEINLAGEYVATGVDFIHGGETYTVGAAKEVIISAGSVNTPQVLELSGIGNSTLLESHGITPLIDLPAVGENLQDHTYSQLVFDVAPEYHTLDDLRNETYAAIALAAYEANEVSILDETVPAITYVSIEDLVGAEVAAEWITEVEAYVAASTAPYKKTLEKQLEYLKNYSDVIGQMEIIGVDGFFAGYGAPADYAKYITILAANQHPFSRGNIHIQSSDPTVYPIINANYFTVDFDLNVATAGSDYIRKLMNATAFSDYITGEYLPGANVTDLTDITKLHSSTEYHPIGTASMLPKEEGGVVSPELIVYGTTNLRVADASILPLHVSSHTQGPVYMIGEIASELILSSA